jgi:hypothetical protein
MFCMFDAANVYCLKSVQRSLCRNLCEINKGKIRDNGLNSCSKRKLIISGG